MLGERLARATAEGTNIDTTSSTKYTEWVELVTFSGRIAFLVGIKEEGADEVRRHVDEPNEVFF